MNRRTNLTQHLVDSILYLLITDGDFLAIARQVLPAKIFQSRIVEKITALCFIFFDTYRRAPEEHFQDEFKPVLERFSREDRKLAVDYATRLQAMRAPNKAYVMQQLHDFIRGRKLEAAALETARAVEAGKLDEAEQAMLEALRSGIPMLETGLDYTHDENPMARRNETSQALTSCGWKLLDQQMGGGLCRGRLIAILGKYKGFKTYQLTQIGADALKRGLNVAHITHEVSAAEQEQRYDQIFGSFHNQFEKNGKPITGPLEFDRPKIVRSGSGKNKRAAIESIKVIRPSIWDAAKVAECRRTMKRTGGRLFIRKYPMGAATMLDVFGYLDFIEQDQGVTFDVVINDYADIMAPVDSRMQGRDAINDTYIRHKRLADERNCLVVTASQSTRNAIDKAEFSQKDFAEDIRKLANVDGVIGVGQTREQEECGTSQAVLLASRTHKAYARVVFGRCLDIGQPVVWEAYPKELEEKPPEGTQPPRGAAPVQADSFAENADWGLVTNDE